MLTRELRRLTRAASLTAHLLLAAALAFGVLLLPAASRARYAPKLAAGWLRGASSILGLRVLVHGRPVAGPVLLAANHLSWLDILVLAAAGDASFVAKAEVGSWPLLGWLVQVGGTEFVRRGSHADLGRVRERLTRRLKGGETLVLFPEGTSGAAVRPARFRPRLLQAAVDAGVPLQPVAIYYGAQPELLRRVAFVGDAGFLTHLWALLGAEPVLAEVCFLPPLGTASGDLRLLAGEAWSAVTHTLTRLELFELDARHAVPTTAQFAHTA